MKGLKWWLWTDFTEGPLLPQGSVTFLSETLLMQFLLLPLLVVALWLVVRCLQDRPSPTKEHYFPRVATHWEICPFWTAGFA